MTTQLDWVPLSYLMDIYEKHGTITVIDGDKKEATVVGTASDKEIINYEQHKSKG